MAAIDASGVMDVDASGVVGVAPPVPAARSWFCMIAAVVTTSIVLIIGIVATMSLEHAGPWATTTTTFTTTTSTSTTSTWTGHEDVDHLDFTVGSYNLFWWCVSNEYNTCRGYGNGKGFKLIDDVIIKNGPYDFIGFQECNDINIILKGAGLSETHDFYNPQAGEHDAPMAWSKKFTKLGSPGQVTVATDKYGPRFMNWVRLIHLPTGKTIFFANTHGPLGQCSTKLGQTYLDSIAKYMKPEDHLILTGDFNCPTTSATIQKIKSVYSNAATGDLFAGADHVLVSTDVKLLKTSTPVGRPSDHNILLATIRMPVKYSAQFTV